MKNLIKMVGISALIAVIGFSMVSCDNEEEEQGKKKVSGTVTAGLDLSYPEGVYGVTFRYNGTAPSVSVTTNLPAPNDSFTLSMTPTSARSRSITGLTEGQQVTWTASVSSDQNYDLGGTMTFSNVVSISCTTIQSLP